MLNEILRSVYQEESGEDGSGSASLLDGASGGDDGDGGESGDWFHAEGVQGEGDRPEYLQSKFKDVGAQAKGYSEMEKRFGAHSGAPEEYDLALPEGASELIQFDPESEGVKTFLEAAKEGGVNQDFISQAVAFHVAAMEDALGDLIPNSEAELSALGKDAQSRIDNVADWGQANLDKDQFEQLRAVTMTADGVELVESLIAMTKGAKVVDSDTTVNTSKHTAESLREMRYAKDEHGNEKIQLDPEYKKKVDAAYAEFYGTGQVKDVVTM